MNDLIKMTRQEAIREVANLRRENCALKKDLDNAKAMVQSNEKEMELLKSELTNARFNLGVYKYKGGEQ